MNPLIFLQKNGWTKHSLLNDKGQVCLVGALRNSQYNGKKITIDGRVLPVKEIEAIVEVIKNEFPDRTHDLARFNDDPRTTREDIELVLGKVYGCGEEI